MKDIFTDLYNKVLGFFRQSEKKEEESAKDVACNRLKFVLMQDRTNLTPELMDRMRKELIELLSKYVEMDKEALELGFEQEGSQMALMLSIPVLRAREEAEIEATLAEEDAKKTEEETDEVTENESEENSTDNESESNSDEENDEKEENEFIEENKTSDETEPEIVEPEDAPAKETSNQKEKSKK